jgi:RNA polymerase sigma-70 factor, ECF subfamily
VKEAEPDLASLIARCRKGDELAWELFVRRFQSRVYGIACHYTGKPEDARDVAQDIFVRLYEIRDKWADVDHFLPWLVCLARNRCIDHLRRRKKRYWSSHVSIEETPALVSRSRSPEELALLEAKKGLVGRALGRLTAISREIVLLKEIQGLSIQEIAGLLGIPIGTVKSRSNRARLELAQQLVELEAQGEVRSDRHE